MTLSRRQLLHSLALSPLAAAGSASWAQDKFPARPMEMIVPWGPGGGADTVGRMVARWFESDLGGTMAVLNAPGATGVIGLSKLLQATGWTLICLRGTIPLVLSAHVGNPLIPRDGSARWRRMTSSFRKLS